MTVAVANQSPSTAQGAPIEVCEGTDGCHCRLPGGGHLSGCGRDLRDDAQDGETDRGAAGGGRRASGRGVPRGHNYDAVAELVAERVGSTQARISAKRLLPEARAAGYCGSARNFRRLVGRVKRTWRRDSHRGRRPGVWSPGETLLIDWGAGGRAARVLRGAGLVAVPVRTVRRRRAGERRPWRCWPSVSRCWAECRRWCWPTGWAA